MCVIVYKKPGSTLSLDLVSKLWEKNSDGAGYMVRHKGGGWKHRKGIMQKEDYLKSIKNYLDADSELVTHMRIKTKGTICAEHTHPFEFSRANDPRFMFHNGTVKFLNHKIDSDSMFLARILKNVETEEAHSLLKKYSENGFGRFVTVTNGEVKVFGDDESIEDEGVWFSNKRHRESKSTVLYLSGGSDYGDYDHCDWGLHNSHQERKEGPVPFVSPNKVSAEKRKLLNDLGKFYALKDKVAWSDSYQSEFEEENGAETIQDTILERIVELSKQDTKYESDPLFEFYLAFAH